jgi:hypothetical protein
VVKAANSDLLIFIDGDCIPHPLYTNIQQSTARACDVWSQGYVYEKHITAIMVR